MAVSILAYTTTYNARVRNGRRTYFTGRGRFVENDRTFFRLFDGVESFHPLARGGVYVIYARKTKTGPAKYVNGKIIMNREIYLMAVLPRTSG